MSYARTIRVEFNHCDPAGIVFYPRYFEMTNSVMENFFREVVGYSYHAMMADGIGVPTARVETDFRAPSRLGDVLDWGMVVEKVGGSSATFRLASARVLTPNSSCANCACSTDGLLTPALCRA